LTVKPTNQAVGFLLTKSVFEALIAFSFGEFPAAIRAKMLLFAVELPCVIFPFKSLPTNITTPWL